MLITSKDNGRIKEIRKILKNKKRVARCSFSHERLFRAIHEVSILIRSCYGMRTTSRTYVQLDFHPRFRTLKSRSASRLASFFAMS